MSKFLETLKLVWGVIFAILCVLGMMAVVWDLVQREQKVDQLILEHNHEAKR